MALSQRGLQWAMQADNLLIWRITKDLWHPDQHASGVVSLGIAENSLMHAELTNYISNNLHISEEMLTYGDGAGGREILRQALARFLTRQFTPAIPLTAEHICITNGVSSAVEHLSSVLADPGDIFLLGKPYFGGFLNSIGLRTGTVVVPVSFGDVDPLSMEAVEVYESAIKRCICMSKKVAALVLCHPHNPLGRCYSRQTLKGWMRLCAKYSIHLISDEIYALSVFQVGEQVFAHSDNSSEEVFISLCAIEPTGIIDPSLVHVVYGLSKDFGANGLRIGCIISQNNVNLHRALVPPAVYSYASSISEVAAAKLLNDDLFIDWYLVENRKRLKQKYDKIVTWAEHHHIQYQKGVNAAFFLWIKLGPMFKEMSQRKGNLSTNPTSVENLDTLIQNALLAKRVFLVSGANCGNDAEGWFRIVFSQADHNIKEGLRRIESVLGLLHKDGVP
ncbi:hypothetical protein LTR84_009095 [Exophiala bonariae]|uniref:Aminotransferase class I/classII large domain-containing protein n=1 Tax=Exophiala bonariae TaxID=1690606 RepID=A0AAV9MXT2_9EURO|nr:hypothetical protein LTR84_009095 [Exophiala bonariae]